MGVPAPQRATSDAEAGRGLNLIDALTAGRWGWQPGQGPVKVVWAELAAELSGPEGAVVVQDLQATGAGGRRYDEIGDGGGAVLGLLVRAWRISAACSQISWGVSIRSRDASSCSFIRARSWMFLIEYSISSSVSRRCPPVPAS